MSEDIKWYENDVDEDNSYSFKEYEVSSTPNDFNTKTIIDFIESGLFKIPGFQRNYIWDIKRASKLIESLIIGLPIPQVFLYEEGKNNYLVIDGQQRLLTIYFFYKKRFPKSEKRSEIRQIFNENNRIPDEYLHNDDYFSDFKLKLNDATIRDNKLDGLNYLTLGEFKTNFELRTIRNIMIKQNVPTDDDSAMFEIFNRLNSGGVILKPQEIRTSLFHSNFYDQLYRLNLNSAWRTLINKPEPDLHMKDIEIMLRGFAMLLNGNNYSPSMTKFLNQFSKKSKSYTSETLSYLVEIFARFCQYMADMDEFVFLGKNSKFSITVFESIFVAVCKDAVEHHSLDIRHVTPEAITSLKDNVDFMAAAQQNTASKKNVESRLTLACEILR